MLIYDVWSILVWTPWVLDGHRTVVVAVVVVLVNFAINNQQIILIKWVKFHIYKN